ncbi:PilN domain-containing protein [Marinobacterium sediminicola]|uniref:Type IV pilus assembly protein PilN n=1 Tax=Marinobacterium sediminicola TaxID=518898 RepID=A0ABY1S247_9GAMM|nr:PilN domain-containing protein [Marinobacterium sediminicola]ULG69523.1 PilN domain-containing protein [Marinobacterium sediminicola]SMR75675.1 type IV pilus assembly protein PilN [Marinobacterium sediminicola]
MARINLRPWREERNERLQKRFIGNIVGAALLGVLVVLAISYYYDVQMDRQNARNNYMKTEIAKLDQKIKEIQELRAKRERLLERLNAIQQLQGNRPVIVRNFDELVRVLPDGAHYELLVRKGEKITIDGFAENNNEVSELMRRLDGSIWFAEPDLRQVDQDGEVKHFNMQVGMSRPDAEEAK